jgi:hypothetical protein
VWEEAFQRLAARLVAFVRTPAIQAVARDGAGIFDAEPGRGPARERAPAAALRFVEWLLQDHEPEPGHGTLVGGFADHATELSWHEEQLLLGLLLAPLRAHEVTEPLGSRALVTRDLLTGAEGRTGAIGLPGTFIRSDLLVCRLVTVGATRRPGLSLLRLPGPGREEMMAYLRAAYQMGRTGRHVSLEDFLDGSAHLYHHFYETRGRAMGAAGHATAPGHAFAPAGVRYRAHGEKRIRAALARQSELEPTASDGAERWTWLDLGQGIARASVTLGGGAVDVSADTQEALEAGQGFVENLLRGLIALPGERREPPTPTAVATGKRIRGQAFLERIFGAWSETPTVLLGGRVPREAIRTPAGRSDAIAALLLLERDMARQKRLRRAWVDLAALRESLDLPALPQDRPATRRLGS